jgi:D-alanyl-D-alanine carboxypeptidase/D-alanyl-D-alanine-endopeptidase (penicillin-binding protein 4)
MQLKVSQLFSISVGVEVTRRIWFSAGSRHVTCSAATRKMVRLLFLVGVFALFEVRFAVGQEPEGASSLAELQIQLSNHVSQAKFAAALWGVKVVSLENGKVLFEHNAQKLFSPASNSKLYTVALGLDRLGVDYRIKTSLYATAKPSRRGTVRGDLIVYGRGDPTINKRLHHGNIFEALEPLVAALTNAGVKRIMGDLVADESYFHGPPFGSGWAWDDAEYYYGAEISALTINDNTLQVAVKAGAQIGERCKLVLSPATSFVTLSNRTATALAKTKRNLNFYRPLEENVTYATGQMALDDAGYTEDITVHNPAALFGSILRETLARRGIKVSGKVRTVNSMQREVSPCDYSKLFELGAMESLPLSDIAREIMKPSQNLYTDLLLEHVGEQKRTSETPNSTTSEDLGIAELNRFIGEAGLKEGDVLFEEGSGLSRNNLTTPNATIALLEFMSKHNAANAYLDALPIAGVDGTLRNRMKGTAAEGNVRAKTGTLRWANSLSGYVKSAAGERLAFSIMLNRYHNTDRTRSAREEVDAIAVMLAEFKGRVE